MRYIPSLVPTSVQNATALVLQDEMIRRLSQLKSVADWGAMVEELSVSKGSTLLLWSCSVTKVILEVNRRRTSAPLRFMGNLMRHPSLRS